MVRRTSASPIIALLVLLFFLADAFLAHAAATHNTIYAFAAPGNTDGMQPYSIPIADSKGNLYGTTMLGGGSHNAGIVFELSPTGSNQWVESILYEFTGLTDGGYPSAGLVFDTQGNLYGTGGFGGANGTGVVFEMSPQTNGWSYKVLYSFGAYPSSGDGFAPNSPLVFDKAGNMYGITNEGGLTGCFQGCGTVFELSPDGSGGWKEQLIHEFPGSSVDGQLPTGGLTFDNQGNLYGTTQNGGSANSGVLYQLKYSTSTKTWKEHIIHQFVGGATDGSFPINVILIADAAGNLYGTTQGGGTNHFGTVFEMTKSSSNAWTSKILYSFKATYSGDGNSPQAGVTMDKNGNLYGTTSYGGAFNYYGTVFKLVKTTTGSWKETVLYSFTGGADGFFPVAGVALVNGWLYGTADLGGNGSGVVYESRP
jgi:uncharacterized repeat protein (TIGR03803 family)